MSGKTWFWLLTTVVLLGLAAYWGGVEIRDHIAWSRMEARIRELRREASARECQRVVMGGIANPGAAWPHYIESLDALSPMTSLEAKTLSDFASPHAIGPLPSLTKIRDAYVTALNVLHSGAVCTLARDPGRWLSGDGGREADATSVVRLRDLSISNAIILRTCGKPAEAATALLDLCVFGRDLCDNEPLAYEELGFDLLASGLWQLNRIVVNHELPTVRLDELDSRLEALDASFPGRFGTLKNSTAEIGSAFMELFDEGSLHPRESKPIDEITHRRWWMLNRGDRAELFAILDGWATRLGKASEGSWETEDKVYEEMIQTRLDKHPEVFGSIRPRWGGYRRERIAQLRLVRMATHFLATGTLLDLKDPFGGVLNHEISGREMKCWSVGADRNGSRTKEGWRGFDANEGIMIVVTRRTLPK